MDAEGEERKSWWRKGAKVAAFVGLAAAPAGFLVIGAALWKRRRDQAGGSDAEPEG